MASTNRLKGEDRRRQILDVARNLFLQRGYSKTTTAAIASEVQVTEPVLYRHFSSKKDLFLTLARAFHAEIQRDWEDILRAHDDPVDRLRALLARGYGEPAMSSWLMVWRSLLEAEDPDIQDVARAHFSARLLILLKAISQVKDAGLLRGDMDAGVLTANMFSLEMGHMMSCHALGTERDDIAGRLWEFIRPWVNEEASAANSQSV